MFTLCAHTECISSLHAYAPSVNQPASKSSIRAALFCSMAAAEYECNNTIPSLSACAYILCDMPRFLCGDGRHGAAVTEIAHSFLSSRRGKTLSGRARGTVNNNSV